MPHSGAFSELHKTGATALGDGDHPAFPPLRLGPGNSGDAAPEPYYSLHRILTRSAHERASVAAMKAKGLIPGEVEIHPLPPLKQPITEWSAPSPGRHMHTIIKPNYRATRR